MTDSGFRLEIEAAKAFLRQVDTKDKEYTAKATEIMAVGCMKFFKKVCTIFKLRISILIYDLNYFSNKTSM